MALPRQKLAILYPSGSRFVVDGELGTLNLLPSRLIGEPDTALVVSNLDGVPRMFVVDPRALVLGEAGEILWSPRDPDVVGRADEFFTTDAANWLAEHPEWPACVLN